MISTITGKTTSHLIVGQGIAGTMLAFEFVLRGLDKPENFIVVDAGHEQGSSLVSTGIINPLVFKRMTLSWGSTLVPQAWERYSQLEQMLELSAQGTGHVITNRTPILRILANEDELSRWNTSRASASNVSGQPGQPGVQKSQTASTGDYLSPAGKIQLVHNGPQVDAAEILHSGWVNLPLLLSAFRNWLASRGMLIEGSYPDALSNHCVSAERTILATGIQHRYTTSTSQGDEQLQFYPVKGDVLRIQLPTLRLNRLLNSGISIRPTGADRQFEVGSSYVRDFTDSSPDDGGRRWLLGKLAELGLGEVEQLDAMVRQHRAGIRPASRDRLAYLGPMGDSENRLYSFNGLGTKGIMLAPGLARMLADNLLEGKKIDRTILPDRILRS